MKTTIDAGGRVVVPKAIRDELGLHAGQQVDVIVRDGHIEVVPVSAGVRLIERDGVLIAEPDHEMPLLTTELVRDTLDRVRR